MDPVAMVKSALEAVFGVKTVPTPLAWTLLIVTVLLLIAGTGAAIREIKGWWPGSLWPWARQALSRLRFRSPVFFDGRESERRLDARGDRRLIEPTQESAERSLFLMGFCWKIQPRFFEIYRRSHFPEAATLEESILGPLCVKCGRLRVEQGMFREGIQRSMSIRSSIEPHCGTSGCDDQVTDSQAGTMPSGFDLIGSRLAVYREAQRLAVAGLDFPPCPSAGGPIAVSPHPLLESLRSLMLGLHGTFKDASRLHTHIIDREVSEDYARSILTRIEALIGVARSALEEIDPEMRRQGEEWRKYTSRYWRAQEARA